MEKKIHFPNVLANRRRAIPEGYVTTYGDVAKLAGSPVPPPGLAVC